MIRKRIKKRHDSRQKWLNILQSKYDLDENAAKALDKELRASFALNYDNNAVKRVILDYMRKLDRKVAEEDVDVEGIFTTRAGSRRYGRWTWQENLFCVVAYMLSAAFFIIDSIDFDCNSLLQVVYQLGSVMLAVGLFCILDRIKRGNSKWNMWFIAANTFMPSTTIMAYVLFYWFKFLMIFCDDCRWRMAMIAVIVVYSVGGIAGTIARYCYYARFKKIHPA